MNTERRLTRRALVASGAGLAGSFAAGLAAGYSPFWRHVGPDVTQAVLPASTPTRFGPPRLRLVLAAEGLPALDTALRAVVAEAAREVGATVDIEDIATFTQPGLPGSGVTGSSPDEAASETIAHRLLVAVQAGVPPEALLLLGRQGQTARFQSMVLAQDVSGLMRRALRRFGGVPAVTEYRYVIAGNWFAVPQYQRLIGHWIREPAVRAASASAGAGAGMADRIDTASTLRRLLHEAAGPTAPPEHGSWGWGIGAADTPDVDAWCWGVIHAWGGGLVTPKGDRVAIASPETAGALEWLRATLSESPWRENVPPAAASWADVEKNAAFLSETTAYTFTERALASAPPVSAPTAPLSRPLSAQPAPQPAGQTDIVYLPAPAGPAGRPRAIDAGAAWLLPRGASPEPVERFLEALLNPPFQQRLWHAGGGFALPAYNAAWNEPALPSLLSPAAVRNAQRFHAELSYEGFAGTASHPGPETAASQAVDEARLAAGMLRAVLAGQSIPEVLAAAEQRAIQLFRDAGQRAGLRSA